MKLKTLHQYIKYTTKPYTELIDKVRKDKTLSITEKIEKDEINYLIKDKDNYYISLYFNKNDINDGCIVGFNNFR